jgi:rod shape-determining protein MreC
MKKFLFRPIVVIFLLVAMYIIWPNPFWYMSKNVILPVGKKVSDVAKILISPFTIIFSIDDLISKNNDLEKENISLKAQITKLIEDENFCSEVKSELSNSTISLGVSEIVPARVIGRTAGSFNQIITIDKGMSDGITEKSAVTSLGILVGTINKVYSNTSEVKLISSYNNVVPVTLGKSREMGLVRGGIEGAVISDIPSTTVIEEGEEVITSGLGGDLPQGVLVGYIDKIIESKGVFISAKIKLPVRLGGLEIVSVVKK